MTVQKTDKLSQQADRSSPALGGAQAWLVWSLAAGYFFCDYFARVSPGVMVNDLMAAFSVTAAGLGALNFFFYAPYLAMQIPVGLLVDRFGVARLLTIMCIVTGLSCLFFGSAQSLEMAKLGRFLLGFGAAFAFVSALKLASDWFPPYRWGLLATLTQALGMLGAAVGGYPVSYAVDQIGWRNTMFVMVGIFMVLAVLIAFFVRDTPPNKTQTQHHRTTNKEMFTSLVQVLSHRDTWLNAIYAGLIYAPTAVFGELWGVTYLEHVQHISHSSAAFANGLIFIGWGFGGPLMGWLSDRMGRRKPMMYVSALCGAIIMGIVLYIPNLPTALVYVLLFLFGATNTGVAVAYAVAAELNPRRYSGAAMAFTNMASVIIGAALQPLAGVLLDWHASGLIVNNVPVYTATDFHLSMSILPLCSLMALLMAVFVKETRCRNLTEVV